MINIFIKDISNFNFNSCYFKIDEDSIDLDSIKKLINNKYNIPIKNILFMKENKYFYNNIFFDKKSCEPFLPLNMIVRPIVN